MKQVLLAGILLLNSGLPILAIVPNSNKPSCSSKPSYSMDLNDGWNSERKEYANAITKLKKDHRPLDKKRYQLVLKFTLLRATYPQESREHKRCSQLINRINAKAALCETLTAPESSDRTESIDIHNQIAALRATYKPAHARYRELTRVLAHTADRKHREEMHAEFEHTAKKANPACPKTYEPVLSALGHLLELYPAHASEWAVGHEYYKEQHALAHALAHPQADADTSIMTKVFAFRKWYQGQLQQQVADAQAAQDNLVHELTEELAQHKAAAQQLRGLISPDESNAVILKAQQQELEALRVLLHLLKQHWQIIKSLSPAPSRGF